MPEATEWDEKEKNADANSSVQSVVAMRSIPPFIPTHDISRGVVYGIEALLRYALMLAVMYVRVSILPSARVHFSYFPRTFQAAYFITIVAGLAVGEIAFGRLWGTFYAHVH